MRQIAFVAGAPTGTPVGKFIALPIPYSLAGFKREEKDVRERAKAGGQGGKGKKVREWEGRKSEGEERA